MIVVILVGVGAETHWYGLTPAAKATPPGACPGSTTLSGAGASFLGPLISKWEATFTANTTNKINYNPSGAGAGITSWESNTVNFAASDEPLTGSQIHHLPGTSLMLPVTGGAVTIVYNIPGFTRTLNLTGPQLAEIYLGTITNWDDTSLATDNRGLPDATIDPVVRSDAAGTTYVLTNYLADDDSAFSSAVGVSIQPTWPTIATETSQHGNSGLVKYVASAAGDDSIGYVDLADAKTYDPGGIAAMGNPASHFVVPTVADTQSAINYWDSHETIPAATGNWSTVTWVNSPQTADYPLATLSYFLVLQNPGLAGSTTDPSLAYTQVLVEWLDWTISQAQQQYAAPLDYNVPPADILSQDSAALQTINYNGASIPACAF
ncbi:MAG: phosphate ABC transporter substrate-binding protein PstS [Thermoplasmata archaeon]